MSNFQLKMRLQSIAMLTFVILVGCKTTASIDEISQSNSAAQMVAVARLAERQGDTTKARSLYEKLISQEHELRTAHHRMGILAAKRGNHELAETHFAKARETGLDSIEFRADEAYNELLAGHDEVADQLFQGILDREPKHKRTLNNLAVLRAKQGRFQESLYCSRLAVGSAKAHANVGYLFTQFGELALAKEHYHRALGKDPDLKLAAHALLQLQDVSPQEIPERSAELQAKSLSEEPAESDLATSTLAERDTAEREVLMPETQNRNIVEKKIEASEMIARVEQVAAVADKNVVQTNYEAVSDSSSELVDPADFYESMQVRGTIARLPLDPDCDGKVPSE